MYDDQDGCEWVFLLVPAYPGCPGQMAVKWLLFVVVQCHKVITSEALGPGSVLVSRGRRESLEKEECL